MPSTTEKATFGPEGIPYWAINTKLDAGLPSEEELRSVFTGLLDVEEYGIGAVLNRVDEFVNTTGAVPDDLLARVGALSLFLSDARGLVENVQKDLRKVADAFTGLAAIRDDVEAKVMAGDAL